MRVGPMPDIPRVALLIESSRGYGRALLRGVIRYLRIHAPWSVYFEPRDLGTPPPAWLKNWHGNGILARIDDARTAKAVRQTGLPAVDLRFALPKIGLPRVGIDNEAV